MLSDLPVFQIYGAMARHAAESQRVSAENISRAGEPGYKARQVESFDAFLARSQMAEEAGQASSTILNFEANSPVAPNGNSVNIEHEVFRSAEAVNQHNMALSVYTKTLNLMRTAIGKR